MNSRQGTRPRRPRRPVIEEPMEGWLLNEVRSVWTKAPAKRKAGKIASGATHRILDLKCGNTVLQRWGMPIRAVESHHCQRNGAKHFPHTLRSYLPRSRRRELGFNLFPSSLGSSLPRPPSGLLLHKASKKPTHQLTSPTFVGSAEPQHQRSRHPRNRSSLPP